MSSQGRSLVDVARRAGVSIATASRALNGSKHPVAPSTRKRVLAAAEELAYSPSALAQGLVTKSSRIIGVIGGDVVDPYFAGIVRGVEETAGRSGYLTIVCNAQRHPGAERAYIDILRDYRAVGAVFAGSGFVDHETNAALRQSVEAARQQGTTVIALATRDIGGATIGVDNRAASFDLTDYLLSLGHRQIAYVSGPTGLYASVERCEGFRAALAQHGLQPAAIYDGDFTYESGLEAAARILAEPQLPDAIIGANDETAVGVLNALHRGGVSVPMRVSVAGIGNTRHSHLLGLTSVSIPTYELGALAAERILGGRERGAGTDATLLPHRLVRRGTTARRRGASSTNLS